MVGDAVAGGAATERIDLIYYDRLRAYREIQLGALDEPDLATVRRILQTIHNKLSDQALLHTAAQLVAQHQRLVHH
mgnify:CR=1 FL=1